MVFALPNKISVCRKCAPNNKHVVNKRRLNELAWDTAAYTHMPTFTFESVQQFVQMSAVRKSVTNTCMLVSKLHITSSIALTSCLHPVLSV